MSTSSKLLTFAEMDVGDVFVQYLEELRSGTLNSEDGINRPLQQLAENSDALLDVLQAQRSQMILGGGTIAWDATTGVLSWSADLIFRFAHELGGSTNNVLAAGNLTLSASGKIAYVKLDRVVSASSVTGVVVPNMAAFVSVIASNADRLDYQVLVYRDGTDLVFGDGRRLRNGYSIVNGSRDTQYGQQAELTTVHSNQKENLKIILSGGGDISWDSTAVSGTEGTLSWTEPLVVRLPATDGEISITGVVVMGANTKTMEDGDVLYVTLSRLLVGATSVAVSKVAAGNGALAGDDVFVLAVREGDRVYFWNGTAISDGETILLGGVRSGLQWFYGDDGPPGGDQVTSFGSTNEYRVGCGELMIYRNGLKARGSSAYWLGTFPAGSLVGVLGADDQYVEEDTTESGAGYRILWLADDGAACGHATDAHAPGDPFTWPDDTDYIEGFVGVQGDGPSPVESLGVEGEAETAEGAVKFRGVDGVSVALDGNTLVISLDDTAGVTSIVVDGGDPVGGNLQILPGRLIAISRNDFDITFDLDVSDDLADAISGTLGNMAGDTDPSAENPLVARTWVLDGLSRLSGFDLVYAPSTTAIWISPGRVMVGNAVYATSAQTNMTIADILDGDTATDAAWHYIYVGASGGEVVAYISTTPPSMGGQHPDQDIWFLSSVYYTTAGGFNRFVKRGGFVKLADSVEITRHGLPAAAEVTVSLSSFLPGEWVPHATLLLEVTQIDVGGSASPSLGYGVSSVDYSLYVSKSYDHKASFLIDTVVSSASYFHCLLSTDDWLHDSATLWLTGYTESQTWGA